MGTRSLTIVKDDTGQTLATIYRQYDGYPTGQGNTILKAFGGSTLCNGYSEPEGHINGPGDMAVQLVAIMKQNNVTRRNYQTGETVVGPLNSAGGVYLYPAGTDDVGEEFTYTLTYPSPESLSDGIRLMVESDVVLYNGPLKDFNPEAAEAAARN